MVKKKLNSGKWIMIVGIVLLLLINLITHAQELKGRITDEKKKPIYRAHVQLLRDGKLKNRVFTDWKGIYHIWPIEPGGYQALISVEGYDRIIQDIDIKTRDTVRIDFALHKKSGLLSQ